ncbi:MAG: sigma-70 family RNA polymerase sigma factor [Gemmataceae bacterium]
MPSPALSAALGRLARAADPDPPADGWLVTRFARTRDPDAFAELVRRLGPMVLGVCRRVTGHAQDAEDAFQAAFLVFARRAGHIERPDEVRGWVYGVAVRVAREARTVSARRRAREAPVAAVPDRAAEAHSPPDADALRALDEEVAALPEHLRAAVVLCELDGATRKDAATQLGVPEGTLSSRLAKGRKLLADRLRRRGVTAGLAALTPVLVPARLSAAASALPFGPAPAAVSALASGVVRVMVLHKFRAAPVALALFAAAALAAGSADVPRPAAPPVRVAAQPPAPKVPPVGLLVGRGPAVLRLDPAAKQLAEIAPPAEVRFTGRAAASPDGKWIAIAAVKDEPPQPVRAGEEVKPFPLKLIVRRVDGGGEPKVFDLPGFTLEPVWMTHWSKVGREVLVAQATNPGRTAYKHVTVDVVTGQLTQHGDNSDGLRQLDYHPDGFVGLCEQRDAEKKTAKLVLSLPGGGGLVPLTDLKTPPGFIAARFSPDGKKVLFLDGDPARKDAHKWGKSHRPFVLDVATKARAELAEFPDNGQALGVCWSPDGKRVAYAWQQLHADLLAKNSFGPEDAQRETERFLIVADADGRNATTVATEKGNHLGHQPFGPVDWR